MHISEYKNIYKHEGHHFFYKANHEILLSLIRTYISKHKLKILDAGCGTGLFANKLEKYGHVTGLDMSDEAIKYAKKRNINVIKGSINQLPFKSASFDLVVSVDVLYHQQVDDSKALDEIYRVLKKNGLFICRVPAFPWLESVHDRHVHTRERYTKSMLEKRLIKAKLRIEKISYVNILLFFIVYFLKNSKSARTESGVKDLPSVINHFLYLTLVWEKYALRFINLPIGNGLIAVSRK